MARRERKPTDPGHEVVVGNLLDLQARLRGEPASSLPAVRPLSMTGDALTITEEDLAILASARAEVVDLHQGTDDRWFATERIAAIEDRLDRLEAAIRRLDERPDDTG
ncbi:MAG TPA: hypothetical protein VIB62_08830 [Actinomycetota bacterium]|jgi:hypothetical protein